jgi:hypothetical protein
MQSRSSRLPNEQRDDHVQSMRAQPTRARRLDAGADEERYDVERQAMAALHHVQDARVGRAALCGDRQAQDEDRAQAHGGPMTTLHVITDVSFIVSIASILWYLRSVQRRLALLERSTPPDGDRVRAALVEIIQTQDDWNRKFESEIVRLSGIERGPYR